MAGLDSRGLGLGVSSVGVAIRAMAAAGVAAGAAFKVVCGGEDEVWPFVIKVLRVKILRARGGFRLFGVGLRRVAGWNCGHLVAQNNVGADGAALAGSVGNIGARNRCFLAERIVGAVASLGAEPSAFGTSSIASEPLR